MPNNANRTKKYIVTNEQGEEFLLPNYSETFRILMDDKETIRDVLNSVLQLDHDHEIMDLEYEFEKPIDIFMPEDDPSRLDVWVSTRDNRYLNIELQNKVHSFLFDRMQIYNADLTLRGKYEYNRSERFKNLPEEERKRRYYELPETVSIWLCNFPILKSKDVFKDTWSVYSECDIRKGMALPLFPKNKYIVIDLPNFVRLRNGVGSREDFWLRLISKGPLQVPATKDPIFEAARNRLRVSRIKPELLQALEVNMFDRHEYEVLEADAYLKGEADGVKQERKKNEAATLARDAKMAEYFRSKGIPEEIISGGLALK
ncbi:MAG: PD-(D/E)XK nuclease family transposase [Fibrobacter sp.]|jgi:hypothetical protein|nr:PD-(D/E)XK nuclease family transposase [Fibrobacter sp.]